MTLRAFRDYMTPGRTFALLMSLLQSGTNTNVNESIPPLDDAPFAASELQRQRREEYKAQVVSEYCPDRNGHPDDVFWLCYQGLPQKEQEKVLAGLRHYAP